MSSLAELRAQRDAKIEEARGINARTPTSQKMPTADATALDKVLNDIESIDGKIRVLMASAESAGREHWSNAHGSGEQVRILHNAADVREHYARTPSASQTAGESMRLDEFVRGVAGMKTSTAVSASMSTGTDSTGGYAVPTTLMPGILEALMPASTLLQAGAGIIPLDEGAKNFTFAAVDGVPNAAWRLENGAVQESEPTFRAVKAAPKSLAFYFRISRELLADASNMSAALVVAIAQAFAKELDRAGLRGSGTDPEPRGILNTPGVQKIANGNNGAALAGYANFLAASAALLQVNAPLPGTAIMSPRSLVKLGGLVDSTGQPLSAPSLLKDLRWLATPSIPDNLTTGTSSDTSEIYTGDFSKVLFMMREQMSIQLLRETFALNGQLAFLCHCRADVAITYPQSLAVVTGVRP